MGILWKRRSSRRASFLFQLKKVQVQQTIFLERIFRSHNFRGGAGDRGRWGNPIFTHMGFFNFLFPFSQHYEALHWRARNYFSVTQLLPIIAHMQLASHNHEHSYKIPPPPPHHPSPTTPITQSVEEFTLTRSTPFQYFCVWLFWTIGRNFGSNYRRSPKENFF